MMLEYRSAVEFFYQIAGWVSTAQFLIWFMAATWAGKLFARILRNILFPFVTSGVADAGRSVVVRYKQSSE